VAPSIDRGVVSEFACSCALHVRRRWSLEVLQCLSVTKSHTINRR